MKIGFYGHSNCAYRGKNSFIDILSEKFNADIVNTGVRQGSEERILWELKKTKLIDLVIIFHSWPSCLFLPGCDRDVAINELGDERCHYLFDKNKYDYYTEKHHKRFIEKFQTPENFYNQINAFKKHFNDHDLAMNRYCGSLVQIDQYLEYKNLKSIHVLIKNNFPNWFKFSTGIIDKDSEIIIEKYKSSSADQVNGMNTEGNLKLADHLEKIIKLCGPW